MASPGNLAFEVQRNKNVVLTRRTILRPVLCKETNLNRLHALFGDKFTMRWFENGIAEDTSRTVLRMREYAHRWDQGEPSWWIVLSRANKSTVGAVGIKRVARGKTEHIEVAYLSRPAMHGQMFAFEAALAAHEWYRRCARSPDATHVRVMATIHPDNGPSQQLALSIGLTRQPGLLEGLFRHPRYVFTLEGPVDVLDQTADNYIMQGFRRIDDKLALSLVCLSVSDAPTDQCAVHRCPEAAECVVCSPESAAGAVLGVSERRRSAPAILDGRASVPAATQGGLSKMAANAHAALDWRPRHSPTIPEMNIEYPSEGWCVSAECATRISIRREQPFAMTGKDLIVTRIFGPDPADAARECVLKQKWRDRIWQHTDARSHIVGTDRRDISVQLASTLAAKAFPARYVCVELHLWDDGAGDTRCVGCYHTPPFELGINVRRRQQQQQTRRTSACAGSSLGSCDVPIVPPRERRTSRRKSSDVNDDDAACLAGDGDRPVAKRARTVSEPRLTPHERAIKKEELVDSAPLVGAGMDAFMPAHFPPLFAHPVGVPGVPALGGLAMPSLGGVSLADLLHAHRLAALPLSGGVAAQLPLDVFALLANRKALDAAMVPPFWCPDMNSALTSACESPSPVVVDLTGASSGTESPCDHSETDTGSEVLLPEADSDALLACLDWRELL